MMSNNKFLWTIICSLVVFVELSWAQNPIITNQFSADPTARVFGNKIYLYPSHDILPQSGQGRPDWFCMADYHVFSSDNLTDWTDHGVIISQDKVNWVDSAAYSMWAPDCVYKNGKYFFYFPAPAKDKALGRGFSIGVAISDTPYGPFIPQNEPIKNVHGIDPSVFIDNDGQAYLYWAQGEMYVAKLKENMLELETTPQVIENLPQQGLKEGPFTFERKGIYYLTYPHVQNKTECLEYAISTSPMGPFKVAGIIMDEHLSGCWTNHQSIINFQNQWYLFYHHNDLSPKFDKNRSVCIDSLNFNADGTIQKVTPTLRGVGTTAATANIQIDRFSKVSDSGVSVEFLDTLNTFGGWKTVFDKPNAWLQYNNVDFGEKRLKTVQIRTQSRTGGILSLRLKDINGPIIAKVIIPKNKEWSIITAPLSMFQSGIQNIYISLINDKSVNIDWIKFK